MKITNGHPKMDVGTSLRVTINTQPKADEGDIFKAGTLVYHKDSELLLLVTNIQAESKILFSGVVVNGNSYYDVGQHDRDWCKTGFVKFIGNVLLEQEA